jgi:N6-adenosine-specific RNA methylase IME4
MGLVEPSRVLCADPPWKFDDGLPGDNRGAENNYPCMSVEDICTMQLPPLADDCVLFLWRVAAMQQEALDVAAVWDFDVKTEIVWLKKTKTGRRWFGMGHTVRAEHEVCLIGTRGSPKAKTSDIRSVIGEVDDGLFDFEGLEAPALGHSRKPEMFYQIVELLFPGPYVELFARRPRAGWTTIGDQL